MEMEQNAEVSANQEANRRAHPRFGVDEAAVLVLLDRGSSISCRVADFSLGGCRLRTCEPFFAGAGVSAEVTFKVHGIGLRFSGLTQWTDDQHLVGIRFVDLSSRRKEVLAEVLAEVASRPGAGSKKQPDEGQISARQATAEAAPPAEQHGWTFVTAGNSAPDPAPAKMPPASELVASPNLRERRAQVRHEVNDTAKVFLIQLGAALDGRIVDLSLGGCRIQTDSQFLIGIYTRVEVEFHIAGQPFRLGGVIQATQNGRQLGIRFLDMSARKREQMEQLIEDVQEVRQSGRALTPDWQAIEPWQARG